MTICKLNATTFVRCFLCLWPEFARQPGVMADFPKDAEWTKRMLDFFKQLCRKLCGFELQTERHNIDISYLYKGWGVPYDDSYFPIAQALIEHENASDWEEEQDRLLQFVAPLKVIVGYDYSEEAKQKSKKHRKWLRKKIKKLSRMISERHAVFPENKETEYLLVVGCLRKDGTVWWRFFLYRWEDHAYVEKTTWS